MLLQGGEYLQLKLMLFLHKSMRFISSTTKNTKLIDFCRLKIFKGHFSILFRNFLLSPKLLQV